eukprot:11278680-Alexandrium_andersonii.AAC.1
MGNELSGEDAVLVGPQLALALHSGGLLRLVGCAPTMVQGGLAQVGVLDLGVPIDDATNDLRPMG